MAALGDFQRNMSRGIRLFAVQQPDEVDQVVVLEIHGGQVYGEANVLVCTQTDDGVGLFQDHPCDFPDHASLFSQFNEPARGNQAMGGVVPSKQGLCLVNTVGSKVQFGLEVKAEFFVVDGFAKLGNQLQAIGRALFQPLFECDAGLTRFWPVGVQFRHAS